MPASATQRKWQLVKHDKGDWLLPSNDRLTIWRLRQYEEDGSAERLGDDGKWHPVIGKRWAVGYVAEADMRGWFERVQSSWEPVSLDDLSWFWFADGFKTRQEAIDYALSKTPDA
jgi:hypothetical protein